MEHKTNFTFIHPQRLTPDSIPKQNIFLLVNHIKQIQYIGNRYWFHCFLFLSIQKKEIKLKWFVISFTLSSKSIKLWWKYQKPSIKLLKLYVLWVYCFLDPVSFLLRLEHVGLFYNWIFSFVIIKYCTDALNVTVMFFFFFVIFFNEKIFCFFFRFKLDSLSFDSHINQYEWS